MNKDKDMFKFFNEFIFIDTSKNCLEFETNILRKYIINRFHKTIPQSRMLEVLSLIDDIIINLHNKEIENIQNDMYELRENIMYMLDFERVVKEES